MFQTCKFTVDLWNVLLDLLKVYMHDIFRAHQTHYEQFGEITGTVKIEGYADQQIKVQGVRDHSYGESYNNHGSTLTIARLSGTSEICIRASENSEKPPSFGINSCPTLTLGQAV